MKTYIRETAATEVAAKTAKAKPAPKGLTSGKAIAKGAAAKAKATAGKGKPGAKVAKAKKTAKGSGDFAESYLAKKARAAKMADVRFGDDQRIKAQAENPYREGTKAHATFALLAKSATVGAFKASAAKSPDKYDVGYLRYAARDSYLTVK